MFKVCCFYFIASNDSKLNSNLFKKFVVTDTFDFNRWLMLKISRPSDFPAKHVTTVGAKTTELELSNYLSASYQSTPRERAHRKISHGR